MILLRKMVFSPSRISHNRYFHHQVIYTAHHKKKDGWDHPFSNLTKPISMKKKLLVFLLNLTIQMYGEL
jgi:hypothetical protein